MDPSYRWSGVRADEAWNAVINAWENRDKAEWDDVDYAFSKFVSDFFHGDEGMQCGRVVDENGCKETESCKDFENVDGTGPAAYFILNSFAHLSSFLWNNYVGIEDASSTISSLAFAKDFGIEKSGDKTFLLYSIINALTVGFTMGLSRVFNIGLSTFSPLPILLL